MTSISSGCKKKRASYSRLRPHTIGGRGGDACAGGQTGDPALQGAQEKGRVAAADCGHRAGLWRFVLAAPCSAVSPGPDLRPARADSAPGGNPGGRTDDCPGRAKLVRPANRRIRRRRDSRAGRGKLSCARRGRLYLPEGRLPPAGRGIYGAGRRPGRDESAENQAWPEHRNSGNRVA